MHRVAKRTSHCIHLFCLISLILAAVFLSASHLDILCAQDRVPPELYLLHVTVTDLSAKPLVGAEIRFDDELVGITDATGQYYMARKPLLDGDHSVSASFLGLATISRTLPRLAEISQSS